MIIIETYSLDLLRSQNESIVFFHVRSFVRLIAKKKRFATEQKKNEEERKAF